MFCTEIIQVVINNAYLAKTINNKWEIFYRYKHVTVFSLGEDDPLKKEKIKQEKKNFTNSEKFPVRSFPILSILAKQDACQRSYSKSRTRGDDRYTVGKANSENKNWIKVRQGGEGD